MSQCAVCSKRLRSPQSVVRGLGPVCAKNVNRFIESLQGEQASGAWANWAQSQNTRVGVREMAVANARARFLSRIHRREEIPVQTGSIEQTSASRNTTEMLLFERFQDGAVFVHSRSGNDYVITTDHEGYPVHCSCPDHQFRQRTCRHMEAMISLSSDAVHANAQPLVNSRGVRSSTRDTALVEAARILQVPQIITAAIDAEASAESERNENLQVSGTLMPTMFVEGQGKALHPLTKEALVQMLW